MRNLSFVLLTCLAVATAGAATAATTAATAATTAAATTATKTAATTPAAESHPAGAHAVRGGVTSVDATGMSFAVKGEKAGAIERTFVVDAQTKFTSNGKPATFADVKSGEEVTVHFLMKDGKNDATSVLIAAAPAKPTVN